MPRTNTRNTHLRRGWAWLVCAGFGVYIVGVIIGLQKAGPLCGSPLLPQSRPAEIYDALRRHTAAAAECYRNIEAASVPTWLMIALGAALVLAGVTVRIVAINGSPK